MSADGERLGGADGPAGPAAAPALPLVWRPERTRAVAFLVAALLAGSMTLVAVLLPGGGAPWPPADRVAFAGIGLAGAAVLCALARPRVLATRGGLTVVNVARTHRLEWPQIVGVNLRPGDPWVILDLDDGQSLAAMGIQTADGAAAAARAVKDLRALVEYYSYTGRDE